MFRLFGKKPGRAVDPVRAIADKDYDTAIDHYRERLRVEPALAATWHRKLADVLVLADRKPQAVVEYLAASAVLMREDRAVQAIALYRTVLRLDPDNREVRNRLAEIATDREPVGAGPGAVGAGLGAAGAVTRPGATSATPFAPAEPPGPPHEDEPSAPIAKMTIRTRLRRFVPLFSQFDQDELTRLVQIMDARTARAREVVFRQGDRGESIVILARGEIVLSVLGAEGEQVEIERLRDGGFFGEMSALNRTPRNVTATAATDCELLELTRDYLEAVAIAHPRVWDVLAEVQRARQAPVGV